MAPRFWEVVRENITYLSDMAGWWAVFTGKAAIDAIKYEKLDKLNWTEEEGPLLTAWVLEKFNGFGYRRVVPPLPSPYLWSGSGHYLAGKYVADGKYDRADPTWRRGLVD